MVGHVHAGMLGAAEAILDTHGMFDEVTRLLHKVMWARVDVLCVCAFCNVCISHTLSHDHPQEYCIAMHT